MCGLTSGLHFVQFGSDGDDSPPALQGLHTLLFFSPDLVLIPLIWMSHSICKKIKIKTNKKKKSTKTNSCGWMLVQRNQYFTPGLQPVALLLHVLLCLCSPSCHIKIKTNSSCVVCSWTHFIKQSVMYTCGEERERERERQRVRERERENYGQKCLQACLSPWCQMFVKSQWFISLETGVRAALDMLCSSTQMKNFIYKYILNL